MNRPATVIRTGLAVLLAIGVAVATPTAASAANFPAITNSYKSVKYLTAVLTDGRRYTVAPNTQLSGIAKGAWVDYICVPAGYKATTGGTTIIRNGGCADLPWNTGDINVQRA